MFQASRRLLQHRQPMIKFLGKRSTPQKLDHTPHQHPASSSPLPKSFTQAQNSFASYRRQAQQHGPLNSTLNSGGIGSMTGHSLGPVEPAKGVAFDRSELGRRYEKIPWTLAEMEAIESGGASLFN